MTTLTVTLRQRVADKCFSWYAQGDQLMRREITAEQMSALALPGADDPQPRPDLPPGEWTWVKAAGGCVQFDTASGELGQNDFFVGDATCAAMLGLSKVAVLLVDGGWTLDGNQLTLHESLVTELQQQGLM